MNKNGRSSSVYRDPNLMAYQGHSNSLDKIREGNECKAYACTKRLFFAGIQVLHKVSRQSSPPTFLSLLIPNTC